LDLVVHKLAGTDPTKTTLGVQQREAFDELQRILKQQKMTHPRRRYKLALVGYSTGSLVVIDLLNRLNKAGKVPNGMILVNGCLEGVPVANNLAAIVRKKQELYQFLDQLDKSKFDPFKIVIKNNLKKKLEKQTKGKEVVSYLREKLNLLFSRYEAGFKQRASNAINDIKIGSEYMKQLPAKLNAVKVDTLLIGGNLGEDFWRSAGIQEDWLGFFQEMMTKNKEKEIDALELHKLFNVLKMSDESAKLDALLNPKAFEKKNYDGIVPLSGEMDAKRQLSGAKVQRKIIPSYHSALNNPDRFKKFTLANPEVHQSIIQFLREMLNESSRVLGERT